MFYFIFKLDSETRLQKKRYRKLPKKPILKFGEFGIIILNEGRLEFVQLNFFKKIIRKLFTKSKHESRIVRTKVWYGLMPNFSLQTKSKNSRMGKGKGLFLRKVFRVKSNTILFEFIGISFYKLLRIEKRISKKLNVKVKLLSKYEEYYYLWSTHNKYLRYYNKYLF